MPGGKLASVRDPVPRPQHPRLPSTAQVHSLASLGATPGLAELLSEAVSGTYFLIFGQSP